MSELYERFDRLRRDQPQRPLIHRAATGDVLTARDLWSLAQVLRDFLAKAGTAAGQPVVSVSGNTATAIALLLACRNLGVPLLPVDKGASPAEVGAIMTRFGARLLVTSSPDFTSASGAAGGLRIEQRTGLTDGLSLVVRQDQPPVRYDCSVGVAVMKMTSGSTGAPKAIKSTDANLVMDALSIMEAMDIRSSDVQLAAIPLSHAYGLGNLAVPLVLGGTAIVLRDGFVPHQFSQDGRRYGVSVFPGVPFMFDHLLEHLPADGWPPSLRRLMSAGARIEAGTVARFHTKFGRKIHSFYGTSETGGICFDDTADVDAEPTVGRPMPGVTVSLQPEEGTPPDGGRVHVAGPAVAEGYASGAHGASPEEDSPFVHGGFLTGDFGRFDQRDHLQLLGRVSSFINVAGKKVQPQEVEAVLRGAPGVMDVRILGAPDPLRGQQLVACIVAASPDVTTIGLRTYCATQLAPFKIPRQFLFLERIPLTERGKTDRAGLEALVLRHVAATR